MSRIGQPYKKLKTKQTKQIKEKMRLKMKNLKQSHKRFKERLFFNISVFEKDKL